MRKIILLLSIFLLISVSLVYSQKDIIANYIPEGEFQLGSRSLLEDIFDLEVHSHISVWPDNSGWNLDGEFVTFNYKEARIVFLSTETDRVYIALVPINEHSSYAILISQHESIGTEDNSYDWHLEYALEVFYE